jgi:hypothetical protein
MTRSMRAMRSSPSRIHLQMATRFGFRPCFGVAPPCGIERLAGALGNRFHINSGVLLEDWEQISK